MGRPEDQAEEERRRRVAENLTPEGRRAYLGAQPAIAHRERGAARERWLQAQREYWRAFEALGSEDQEWAIGIAEEFDARLQAAQESPAPHDRQPE